MATRTWESLPTDEQRTLLKNLEPNVLSSQYNRPKEFFLHWQEFYNNLPQEISKPEPKEHNPPKDLIVSARRDLSFYEANYELFDNSIDEWRKRGATKPLHIQVDYDLELGIGKYFDDAGGMEEGDVFRVFIPGETTNRDYSQSVIGSFGMGAKKGIFRLTDGAKIISCPNGDVSYTSEVPEKWEEEASWKTRDGRAAPIQKGTTKIYFFKLFKSPTLSELDELCKRTGKIYAPLLTAKMAQFGKEPSKRVHIVINGVEATPPADINWSNPQGAEPRVYGFSNVFKDFLSTGKDIELNFLFYCGLTRQLPGRLSEDAEPDFGIDVYGNGRLIQQFLKDPFGWGTSGMSKSDQASRFIRGQLFINGHSFAIPWDTHKREYLDDHPVAQWLYSKLRPIIKEYKTIAGGFSSNTELRNTVLAKTKPSTETKPIVFPLPVGGDIPNELLPKWQYKSSTSKKGEDGNEENIAVAELEEEASGARLAEATNGERVLTITLSAADYDDLMQRFGVNSPEELETVIRECLTGGVAFTLTSEQLATALTIFKCDGDVGELSEVIRSQLLTKLQK
jgi:hypothetical protein